MTFNPEGIIKRTKGKMIMLYAVVEGEETHMASFFHADKAEYVLDAIKTADGDIDITDEDAPKGKKKKKQPAKPTKKIASKKIVKKGKK